MRNISVTAKSMLNGGLLAFPLFLLIYVLISSGNVTSEQQLAIGIALFFFVLSSLLGLYILQLVVSPLHKAVALINKISDGEYDNEIVINGNDEIAVLLNSIKNIQGTLKRDVISLRKSAKRGARITAALDNMKSAAVLVNSNNDVLYLNQSLEDMFKGYENGIKAQVPSFSATNLLKTNIEAIYSGAEGFADLDEKVEDRFNLGDGIFDLAIAPIYTDEGERLGTTIEWVDMTQQVNAELQIKKLLDSAAKGRLHDRMDLDDSSGFIKLVGSGVNKILDVVIDPINDTDKVLAEVAQGNLVARIDTEYVGEFASMKDSINSATDNLSKLMGGVNVTMSSIRESASEIASGNSDLSNRVEEQAASLEETAASMKQISTTVNRNADSAQQANQLAVDAREKAKSGGGVVKDAIKAMQSITDSSNKIVDIISVIDSIAFQTNLLALNAAVEAARAGEQGRGFAVVAGEVRNLAQRSADAAKQIKALIDDSVEKVQDGSALVDRSGDSLEELVQSVTKVADIVAEISAASQEQRTDINQVNQAVANIDQVNQQNAALVEEAAAASISLDERASGVAGAMEFFNIAPEFLKTGVTAESAKFIRARMAHLAWKGRIRGFLDGFIEMDEKSAVSHKDCVLGQWYYGSGISEYGNDETFQAIEKPHAEMHQLIKDILQLVRDNKREQAEQEFKKIEPLSKEIVALIDEIEMGISLGTVVKNAPSERAIASLQSSISAETSNPVPKLEPQACSTSSTFSIEDDDSDDWAEF